MPDVCALFGLRRPVLLHERCAQATEVALQASMCSALQSWSSHERSAFMG